MNTSNQPRPLISLVGAGPGDPELITVKGLARLREADVILHDALISPALLREARRDARIIDVGKRHGQQRIRQGEIHALLIRHAQAGRFVVRLKGGDPFVFGRGGEEAEALEAAGIPYEVIPGVSSAVAAPASAGIPLTHRTCAASFAVVTGHRKQGNGTISQDWEALSRIDTLVILMGMHNLARITAALIAAGRAADTPAAVIQWGTTPQQVVVTGKLQDIAARAGHLSPPATIVIGDVVRQVEAARQSPRLTDYEPYLNAGRTVLQR